MGNTAKVTLVGITTLAIYISIAALSNMEPSSDPAVDRPLELSSTARNPSEIRKEVKSEPRYTVSLSDRSKKTESSAVTLPDQTNELMQLIIESDKRQASAQDNYSAYARANAVYEIKWKDLVESFQLDDPNTEKLREILIYFQAKNSELSHQFVEGLISLEDSMAGKITLAALEDRLLEVLTPEQFQSLSQLDRDYTKAVSDYFDNAEEIRKSEGITDVMKFALSGDYEQLRAHVLAGADVNAKDYVYGRTALMDASSGGHSEIVSFLIDAGANVNEADSTGSTAIEAAIFNGNVEAVQILVDAGADIHITNDLGISPLTIGNFYEARGESYGRIAEILREADR